MKGRIPVPATGDDPAALTELAVFLENHDASLAKTRLRNAAVRARLLPIGPTADPHLVAGPQCHALGELHPALPNDIAGACLCYAVAHRYTGHRTIAVVIADGVAATPAFISSHSHRSYSAP